MLHFTGKDVEIQGGEATGPGHRKPASGAASWGRVVPSGHDFMCCFAVLEVETLSLTSHGSH